MKTYHKILLTLGALVAINSSFGISLLQDYQGDFVESHVYKFKPITGTNQNSTPVVNYAGNTYVANGSKQPTFESTPDIDSAWSALTVESTPATLTSAHLFVGNGSNVPTDRAITGAISISNTGVVTPTTASFWTTPSGGNQNNVLTGVQNRYCTSSVAVLNAESTATGTCTYGTAFTTGTYAVTANIIESTAGVPVSVKVTSATTTGFTYSVTNLSSTTAFSGTGSVNGLAVGH